MRLDPSPPIPRARLSAHQPRALNSPPGSLITSSVRRWASTTLAEPADRRDRGTAVPTHFASGGDHPAKAAWSGERVDADRTDLPVPCTSAR